jgi:hypothetical protein
MARKVIPTDPIALSVARIEMQLQDRAQQAQNLELIRERVRQHEQRYNILSQDVHRAIDEGVLRETHEVCQWILDYNILVRLGEA